MLADFQKVLDSTINEAAKTFLNKGYNHCIGKKMIMNTQNYKHPGNMDNLILA